jgi:hypoxanthine phosphoribosyltransferase
VNGEVKFLNKLAWADQHCPEYKWDRIKPCWVTTAQLSKDILSLVSLLPEDITSVTGVARSGLVVGSQIASYLHLPLYSLDIFDETTVRCGSGFRLRNHIEVKGKTLIVDDTVTTYQTMAAVKQIYDKQDISYYTAAVYVTPGNEDRVNYFVSQLATPHFLEWNFFNSHYNDNLSYDMDGVICQDSFLNDEKAFEAGMDNIKPKYLPRNKPIPIITGRPERLRERTLAWLRRYGVQVKSLTMSQTRNEYLFPAKYKAANIKTKIFVESCPQQAKDIKALKPDLMVVCPTSGEVL